MDCPESPPVRPKDRVASLFTVAFVFKELAESQHESGAPAAVGAAPAWYEGTVVAVSEDGRAQVQWDDGDEAVIEVRESFISSAAVLITEKHA